jgi:hypothetical protein
VAYVPVFVNVPEASNAETDTDVQNLANPFIRIRLVFGMRLLFEMYLLLVSTNNFNITSHIDDSLQNAFHTEALTEILFYSCTKP